MRHFIPLCLLLVAGCGHSEPPRNPEPRPFEAPKQVLDTEDEGRGNRPMQVDLDNADGRELLSVVEQAIGRPVLVHATAIPMLGCVIVSMHVKEKISANEFAERVWQELRAKGFVVKPAAKGFEISRDEQEGAVDPCPRPKQDAEATTSGSVVDEAKVEAEMRAGIKKVSTTERTMTRHALDLFTQHSTILTKKVRIVPETENGKVVGLRLFGIRSDSIMGDLGFENGDRLETINGKSVATPEQALETYALLSKMKTLDVGINRRAQSMKLMFRIID